MARFKQSFSKKFKSVSYGTVKPIRAELYSVERLEQFAVSLAEEHKETDRPKKFRKLLPRLEENGRVLLEAYRNLSDAIRRERVISPAAEWLVDNFHIVEEQVREVREDLPRGFYRELPKLVKGELSGYPRIYAVAVALVAHTDSRLDVETLKRFLLAYQTVTPLNIGELWAVAITLRLVLVENLRRLATRIVTSRKEREEADILAHQLLELAEENPEEVVAFFKRELDKREDMGSAFVVQLTRQLREQNPVVAQAFELIEERFLVEDESVFHIVQTEHQRQAATQVTVGNIITSMRLLSTIGWQDFFESVSLVEPILGNDPADVYRQMDFETRDRYRDEIERIAKRSEAGELEIALSVVKLARKAKKSDPKNNRRHHIGFFLIDDGLGELEAQFNYKPRLSERYKRFILRHPTFTYLGSLVFLTALIITLLAAAAARFGASPPLLIGFALLSLIPASDLAIGILNWNFTLFFKPNILARINTASGIPESAKTMVVVPTLLTGEEVVRHLLENLEIYYLANRDENIYFALLGDFADEKKEENAQDVSILETALGGIEELNDRYANGAEKRFHLFHRRRLWNEREGKWMGWERKRGKLYEFNRLLRGATDTSFIAATADEKFLPDIRFVITLDSDTQLPRDTARKLVGTALHPLNRPQFDPGMQRVVKGYGILQPRVSISLSSAQKSFFSSIFSGGAGIDPYTTAASDIYQDLFGEGIFTGKGLYDVDAFEEALENRAPENSILSHDLFEGLYARCALVTNLEVIDDFPAFYDSFAQRAHRWVRGDWQIARWIFPFVKNADGKTVRNRLPLISRWKIFDNLRRSLVAPAVLVWLAAVWTVVPGSPFWWTLFAFLLLAFPIFAHLHTNLLIQHPRGITWISHFWSVWEDLKTNAAQVVFATVCIAHQAYLKTDAIVRTWYRKLISRRSLLEWTTAAQAEFGKKHDFPAFLRFMWPAPVIASVVFFLVLWNRPTAMYVAAPFLILWFLSPVVAFLVSRPIRKERIELSAVDANEARLIARRTWRFFETFVGDEDNWLPPDNFQSDPHPVVAHRTSPTNIGLLTLSTVAARDFGYIGTLELIERLEMTFATLGRLKSYRGHFLNWYDTRSLETLKPEYISTVDSGNLAGHLLALKQALTELPSAPVFDTRIIDGLSDTVKLMRDEAQRLSMIRQRTEAVTVKQLSTETEACVKLFENPFAGTVGEIEKLLKSLAEHAETINDISNVLAMEHGDAHFSETKFWSHSLLHQSQALKRDLDAFFKWKAENVVSGLPGKNDIPADLQEDWAEINESLDSISSLSDISRQSRAVISRLKKFTADLKKSSPDSHHLEGLKKFVEAVQNSRIEAAKTLDRIEMLTEKSGLFVELMNFDFLIDKERKVFAIGYRVSDEKLDNSYYDLLASEARLASFVAIAKGDAPQEHWFRLGRPQTPVNGSRALVSWTATMFEYLMPALVMRDYEGTLLDQTYKSIVERQIEYGGKNKVPWGISEAAFNARDLQLNYQYGPFGIPGLGLKRGLSEDLVITPYATALAALVDPRAAMENFKHLERENALGFYGFYESIDYTPERVPPAQKKAIIYAYMAHHQGMILVALDNLLNNNIFQRRFHSEPVVQATEMLLQERIPRGVAATRPRAEEVLSGKIVRSLTGRVTRIFDTPFLPTPRTQILSNGNYSLMVTNSGAGYSMCGELAVTRWREDTTFDSWGSFLYIRDTQSGVVWSTGFQPTGKTPTEYEAAFSEDRVVISRLDDDIHTRMEIIVSPEDNAEIRSVALTNHSNETREIELTSYAEVVLAPHAADVAHPAFSNLSIETEFIPAENSLIAKRRPRSPKDNPIWAIHTVTTDAETIGASQFETDRARFLGRGHDVSNPVAVIENRPLSNTVGAVLDPIFSLRRHIRIQPHETVRVSFSTAVAYSQEEAFALADKYHNPGTFEREAALAWTRSQVELRHLNIDAEDAHLYQRLASRILYSEPSLRPSPHVLSLNTGAQSNLWAYGIGGDLPVVLTRISRNEDLPIIRQLLHAHEYLRLKGLKFDLVIMNDHPTSYIESLQDDLIRLIKTSGNAGLIDQTGGVFLRRADQMPDKDRILLHTVARAVIVTERGSFESQLLRKPSAAKLPPRFVPRNLPRVYPETKPLLPELTFFNGLGGFSGGGKEYVTVLGEGQWTPAPWSNIVANELDFGFQISETGAGFTWSVNSRENRLTPWSNDAVSDPNSEAIYLRDEHTGTIWSPTPLPIREDEPYVIRHGQGYSIFEHLSHGIEQELLVFVPLDASVKISLLRLKNKTKRVRRISVTSYNELVLGFNRERSAPFIITEIDKLSGAVFAHNPYNNEFAERVAFAAMSGNVGSITCDRKEFFGRNAIRSKPDALFRENLSGRDGAGLDSCAAIQTVIELAPEEEREVFVLLGEEATHEKAAATAAKFRDLQVVKDSFQKVTAYWDELLGTIEVKTPDAALDTIVNRWLLYQSLACRVWARSAFYQSGGAYGFRDQLQDVMALVYSHPEIAREQILRAARHQFVEGDVQHWWHPPTGRGVRTRFSDDLLWLPFVTCFYIQITGEDSILDEVVPFLEAPPLQEGQDDSYTQPNVSSEKASIFEHCARAVDRSLAVGEHGLPLMGSGDWNDGMNHVGNLGQGESVWVGWFLLAVIEGFLPFCDARDERGRSRDYRAHSEKLAEAIERNAWDGDWYRRAYFDDGTPLGSVQNEECRIDSIVQSWGVISGFADSHRAAHAMNSVEEYLVKRGDGLVLLFTPPFDDGPLDPGYIKGYLPGVRENGGQYTHAAIWTLIAFALLGDGDRAGELFALLNPINHASTRAGLHRYKVEPYVTAGDVYGIASHSGRGGWTWYTGSSSWMYRSAVENILGFKLLENKILKIEPCIPRAWREFEIIYRRGKTEYHIKVENPLGVCKGITEISLDGKELPYNGIPLSDDGEIHNVNITLGVTEIKTDKQEMAQYY